MTRELYRQEDAQQILQLAIARQADAGELTREQLYEIAAELNIAPSDMQAAEQEWQLFQGESKDRQAFNLFRHHKFQRRLIKYLTIGGFFLVLEFFLSGGVSFSRFIVLFWGLGIVLDAWKTYGLKGEYYEGAFQKWRQTRQLKQSVTTMVNRLLGV